MTRALVAAAIMAAALTAPAHANPDHTPACANEDSPGRCVWDARHMGDGNGHSFIRRASGELVYVTHARAHRLKGTAR